MNPIIEKLMAERKKNTDKIDSLKGKIAKLKTRNKEIDCKIKEAQNTEIIGAFEVLNMTPEEFAAFAAEHKKASVGGSDADGEN